MTARGHDGDSVPQGLRTSAAWTWRLLILAAGLYVLLRFLSMFEVLVIPLMIGLLLVALIRPVTNSLTRIRFGRGRMPRGLAAFLTVVLALLVVAGLLALIGQQIAVGFPSLRNQSAEGLTDLQRRLASSPLHITNDQINSYVDSLTSRLRANSGQVVSGAVQVTSRAADVGAGFFVVLFSTFFFLSGGDRIWAWLVGLLPRAARQRANVAGELAWSTLTSFVRATVIVALVDGIGVGVVAWILRVPLPVPLGVLVFLGAFVPIVGALVSGSAAVLVALVAQGPVVALAMLGGVLAVQQLEAHVLQPFLLGRAVSVHPLGVIIAIGAGVILAGIPGALFAVPITAVSNVVISYLLKGPAAEAIDADDDAGPAERAGPLGDAVVDDAVVDDDRPEPRPVSDRDREQVSARGGGARGGGARGGRNDEAAPPG
jgi:predicted PurR-regulated permease PerM